MYMNRVTLVGFTGAEAKHTATQGGKAITRFSLATTKRYKSGNEWKDNTQWHDCVVYNTSVKAAESIQKGDHLLIEGELQYREYERTVETAEGPVTCNGRRLKSSFTRLSGLTATPNKRTGTGPLHKRPVFW